MSIKTLMPGDTLGVIGGGQLGRYFVLEARRLGYNTWVLDPDESAPAMQVAAHPLVAAYDDEEALRVLADACDAVTIEFENVPAASLSLLAEHTRLAPAASAVHIAQDRLREKRMASEAGLRPVPYAPITTTADIEMALQSVSLPGILKTAQLGYDGKGQQRCKSVDDVRKAFSAVGEVPCVLEQQVTLVAEVSVVLARGFDGESRCFPVAENVHVNGVLHLSTLPASQPRELLQEAQRLAVSLADAIDYHGVLAVEFFVDDTVGLYFNEMAPRPHNSGHYTLDATASSQFEQQLRVLCGLPLGQTELLKPVSMLNLLGDSWQVGEPDWQSVFGASGACLHLYGKLAARPGRKMGHINCLSDTAETARQRAQMLHSKLKRHEG
ncbi:MAG: 5-(carboxyamino)imidazole ribonucleotide synthase [Granulosicoccus sp.]